MSDSFHNSHDVNRNPINSAGPQQVGQPHDPYLTEEGCAEALAAVDAMIAMSSQTRSLEGKSLGRYAIVEQLGRGGMGEVYKAWDPRLGRHVAIKVPTLRIDNPELLNRFTREMENAAKLEHDNVVRVYDGGNDNGQFFFVMEFIEGRSLNDIARSEESLPVEYACCIIHEAAQGIAYLHDNGFVHRDIKPSNLIVNSDGKIKILDFGLAKSLRSTEQEHLTATGVPAGGTIDYMSPEQCDGQSDVDEISDIYSLGVTFYRLLTGKLPSGISPTAPKELRFEAMLRVQPIPIGDVCQELPRDLCDLVDRMVSRSRSDRPQSMSEVAKALRSHAEVDKPDVIERMREPRSAGPAEFDTDESIVDTKRQYNRPRELRRSRSFWPWVLTVCVVIGLMIAAATIIVTLPGGLGTLQIETYGDDVLVEVSKQGRQIEIVDTSTRQEIELKFGTYQLELKGPSSHKIVPETIEIRKAGKVIAVVQRTAGNETVNNEPNQVKAIQYVDEQIAAKENLRVAEWVIQVGGSGQLETVDGKIQRYSANHELPTESFALLTIDVPTSDKMSIDSDDLFRFRRLLKLRALSIHDIPAVDKHLQHLESLIELELLMLRNTHLSGDGLKYLKGMDKLTTLDLWGSSALGEDQGVSMINTLTSLQVLRLAHARISPKGMESICKLDRLRWLDLSFSKIDFTHVWDVQYLSELQTLELDSVQLNNKLFAAIAKLPQLNSLNLRNTNLTDNHLKELTGLRDLRILYVFNTNVTDQGVAHIARMTKMDDLELSMTKIGDDGVAMLSDLPKLRWLRLDNTRITDEAAVSLAKLRSLRELEIVETDMTLPVVQDLREQLPKCTIWFERKRH